MGLGGTQITDVQAAELLHALDTNGDGVISYEEFVSGFRLVTRPSSPPLAGAGGGKAAPPGARKATSVTPPSSPPGPRGKAAGALVAPSAAPLGVKGGKTIK
jgi:hypothetical protein